MKDKTIRVLSIEDNSAYAMLIQEKLAEAQRVGWDLPRFEVEHVDRLQAALACLGDRKFDVVLSDLDLPDSKADETVATLREHIPHMPLVVLTEREGEALARKNVCAGVQDYIYKSEATGSLLARTMMYAIERQRIRGNLEQCISERTVELRQANEELKAKITKCRRMEEARERHIRELQLIVDTVTEASRMHDVDELCELVGKTIHAVNRDACVVVSLYNRDIDAIQVQTWAGLDDEMARRVFALLGGDPRNMSIYPDAMGEEANLYTSGELERVPGGLYRLLNRKVPRERCQAIEELLGIHSIYTVGFALGNKPYGGISLCLPEDGDVQYRSAIETFASHFSVVIQQREVEEALKKSEARYRDLFENSPIGLYRTTPKGKILDGNKALERMLGCPSREYLLEKANALDFYLKAEDRARVLDQLDAPNTWKDIEVRLRRCDGEIIWVSDTGRAVRDEEGRIRYYDGALKDITERKRAQEALERRSRELELLHRVSHTFGATLDLDQVFTTVLEEVRRLLDVVACSIWLLDSDTGELVCQQATDPRKELIRGWRLAPGVGLAGHVVRYGESFIVSDTQADDRYFEGVEQETGIDIRSILGVPLQVKGEVVGVIEAVDAEVDRFTLEDMVLLERMAASAAIAIENARLYEQAQQEIAERKQAEERLHEAHAELVAIYDNAPVAMLLVDRERRVRKVNGAAAQFAARPAEKMIGLRGGDALRCIHALDDPRGCGFGSFCATCPIRRVVLSTFETGRSYNDVEVKFPILRGGKKEEVWIRLATTLLSFEGGERVLLCARDVTARKRAEEELERYATELERSNQSLEQFAYTVSHDLQAPLRVVRGYLNLLIDQRGEHLETQARKYIDYALDGVGHMQEMIKALLDLSRVGTRGQEFAPTDTEVVLERTLKSLEWAIEDAEAEVTHGPLPTVMADEAQLTQVFQNLVANAIKFRQEDVLPQVHISARREDDRWMFSVEDNGIGINPEQTERIFQVFQRLHTEEEYPGLGLGLALCKRIVERHDGRIWVESEQGEGSTFYFTLPSQESWSAECRDIVG